MKRLGFVIAIMLIALPVVAQNTGEAPPPVQRAMEHVARFLQLDESQMDQWTTLLDVREDTVVPLREEIAVAGETLAELLEASDYDYAAIGEATVAIAEARAGIREAHATYLDGFAGMLDEEQLGRFGFIRRAEEARPLFDDFRLMGLLVGGPHPPSDDEGSARGGAAQVPPAF